MENALSKRHISNNYLHLLLQQCKASHQTDHNVDVPADFDTWRVKPFETHLEGAITRSAALVFGRNLFKIINIEAAPYSPTS
jgi:hypothetical protein